MAASLPVDVAYLLRAGPWPIPFSHHNIPAPAYVYVPPYGTPSTSCASSPAKKEHDPETASKSDGGSPLPPTGSVWQLVAGLPSPKHPTNLFSPAACMSLLVAPAMGTNRRRSWLRWWLWRKSIIAADSSDKGIQTECAFAGCYRVAVDPRRFRPSSRSSGSLQGGSNASTTGLYLAPIVGLLVRPVRAEDAAASVPRPGSSAHSHLYGHTGAGASKVEPGTTSVPKEGADTSADGSWISAAAPYGAVFVVPACLPCAAQCGKAAALKSTVAVVAQVSEPPPGAILPPKLKTSDAKSGDGVDKRTAGADRSGPWFLVRRVSALEPLVAGHAGLQRPVAVAGEVDENVRAFKRTLVASMSKGVHTLIGLTEGAAASLDSAVREHGATPRASVETDGPKVVGPTTAKEPAKEPVVNRRPMGKAVNVAVAAVGGVARECDRHSPDWSATSSDFRGIPSTACPSSTLSEMSNTVPSDGNTGTAGVSGRVSAPEPHSLVGTSANGLRVHDIKASCAAMTAKADAVSPCTGENASESLTGRSAGDDLSLSVLDRRSFDTIPVRGADAFESGSTLPTSNSLTGRCARPHPHRPDAPRGSLSSVDSDHPIPLPDDSTPSGASSILILCDVSSSATKLTDDAPAPQNSVDSLPHCEEGSRSNNGGQDRGSDDSVSVSHAEVDSPSRIGARSEGSLLCRLGEASSSSISALRPQSLPCPPTVGTPGVGPGGPMQSMLARCEERATRSPSAMLVKLPAEVVTAAVAPIVDMVRSFWPRPAPWMMAVATSPVGVCLLADELRTDAVGLRQLHSFLSSLRPAVSAASGYARRFSPAIAVAAWSALLADPTVPDPTSADFSDARNRLPPSIRVTPKVTRKVRRSSTSVAAEDARQGSGTVDRALRDRRCRGELTAPIGLESLRNLTEMSSPSEMSSGSESLASDVEKDLFVAAVQPGAPSALVCTSGDTQPSNTAATVVAAQLRARYGAAARYALLRTLRVALHRAAARMPTSLGATAASFRRTRPRPLTLTDIPYERVISGLQGRPRGAASRLKTASNMRPTRSAAVGSVGVPLRRPLATSATGPTPPLVSGNSATVNPPSTSPGVPPSSSASGVPGGSVSAAIALRHIGLRRDGGEVTAGVMSGFGTSPYHANTAASVSCSMGNGGVDGNLAGPECPSTANGATAGAETSPPDAAAVASELSYRSDRRNGARMPVLVGAASSTNANVAMSQTSCAVGTDGRQRSSAGPTRGSEMSSDPTSPPQIGANLASGSPSNVCTSPSMPPDNAPSPPPPLRYHATTMSATAHGGASDGVEGMCSDGGNAWRGGQHNVADDDNHLYGRLPRTQRSPPQPSASGQLLYNVKPESVAGTSAKFSVDSDETRENNAGVPACPQGDTVPPRAAPEPSTRARPRRYAGITSPGNVSHPRLGTGGSPSPSASSPPPVSPQPAPAVPHPPAGGFVTPTPWGVAEPVIDPLSLAHPRDHGPRPTDGAFNGTFDAAALVRSMDNSTAAFGSGDVNGESIRLADIASALRSDSGPRVVRGENAGGSNLAVGTSAQARLDALLERHGARQAADSGSQVAPVCPDVDDTTESRHNAPTTRTTLPHGHTTTSSAQPATTGVHGPESCDEEDGGAEPTVTPTPPAECQLAEPALPL
eukprot:TRINITY_DN2000_c0_g1_i1.p1 TRINITY_DN2000_c0_g1~~TRINITY_DN2000_c0_g1_i1.p1  ORF type:complete len:1643 (+),score=193.79 TRINITY_DN2000_c0_g1_i1:169-5097(+)